MKIKTAFAFVSIWAVLILLPARSSVNKTTNRWSGNEIRLYVDGNPIPPLPPHVIGNSEGAVADGNPIPPLPPHFTSQEDVLSADGNPIPPLPPHAVGESAGA
jgi:hypothetical protein